MQGLEQCHHNCSELEEDIQKEVVVVAKTNTVVDPWAVVVEPLYTMIANRAVSAATRADHIAVRA